VSRKELVRIADSYFEGIDTHIRDRRIWLADTERHLV
jgi:hypothetical protein